MSKRYDVVKAARLRYLVVDTSVPDEPYTVAICTVEEDAILIAKLLNNHAETQEYSKL